MAEDLSQETKSIRSVQRPRLHHHTSTRCSLPKIRRGHQADKRGTFESLKQVVAAGFDGTSEGAKYVDRDFTDGGVLILSEKEKKDIKSSMKNLKCSEIEKFHNILAYQIELGYDLALSPDNNVSKSPGYEAVLGITSSDD